MAASQLELSKVSLNGQKRKEESNMSEFDLNQLLEQFQTPSNIPKTTRVDSKVQQQSRQPISLLDSWKYIHFVTSQGQRPVSFESCYLFDQLSIGMQPLISHMPLFITMYTVQLSHLGALK